MLNGLSTILLRLRLPAISSVAMQDEYILETVTESSGNVVDSGELREHLRFDDTQDEERLIANILKAAEQYVQRNSGKQFLTATYDLKLASFNYPNHKVCLPRPPLQSVTSISYVDTSSTTQTLSSSLYNVQTGNEFTAGYVIPDFQQVWPAVRCYDKPVTIRFVCGFGSKADVPQKYKQQILLLAAHWFNERAAVGCGQAQVVPLAYQILEQFNMRQEFI